MLTQSLRSFRALVVVCLLFLVTSSTAMIVENEKFQITSDFRFTTLFSFFFDRGGMLDFTLTINSRLKSPVHGLFCSEEQLGPLRSSDMTFDRLCRPEVYTTLCGADNYHTFPVDNADQPVTPKVWTKSFTEENPIPTRERYRVLQLNCDREKFSGTLSYTAVNPGGEYLSLVYVPYKTVFYIICFAWMTLLSLWAYNIMRYAIWNTKVQRLLITIPFFKTVAALFMIGYWRQSSITGHTPHLYYWLGLLSILTTRAFLFFSVLMLAVGLGMTCSSVPLEYSKRMVFMVGFYVLALGMYHLQFEMAFLLMLINYAFIWQLMSMFIAFTQRELDSQADLLRQMEVRVTSTPLYHKIMSLRTLQSAMVTFVICDLFMLLWSSVLTLNMPWMEDVLENVVMFILVFRLYLQYSLRPFNPHFNTLAKTFAQAQTLTTQESTLVLSELRNRIVALDQDDTQPSFEEDGVSVPPRSAFVPPVLLDSTLWKPGKPFPHPLPLDVEMLVRPTAPKDTCVAVVHNPCTCALQFRSQVTSGAGSMYNPYPCYHCELGIMFSKLERFRQPMMASGSGTSGYTGFASTNNGDVQMRSPSHSTGIASPVGTMGSLNGPISRDDDSFEDLGYQGNGIAMSNFNTPVSSNNTTGSENTSSTSPTTAESNRARMERERAQSGLGGILSRKTKSGGLGSPRYERLDDTEDH